MKKILFFICAVLTTLNIYAYTQDNKCMTEEVDSITITQLPWFANNNWLSGFVDSIEAPFNNSHSRLESNINKTIYQIPVNIVIYDNSSAPNITNAQAEQYINYVNRFFESNDVLIQLYIRCAIKRIGNSSHAIIDDNAEAGIVLVSDNESNCINIHFVNDAPFNGMAKSPWQTIKYTCIVRTLNTVNTTYMNSLAHEIGHTLGLPHTFNKNNCRTNCFQECVSRTRQQENYCLLTAGVRKCEENGDCFCDTDADIEADDDYISSYTCTSVTYKSNASNCKKTDNYGENFFSNGHNNALINIMSYWHGCRTKITKMQRGAMYIYSTKKGVVPLNNNSTSFYSNADIDSYENDNYYQNVSSWDPSVVNIMQINSRQYHTFHHSGGNACDVDWVYFQNSTPVATPYIIKTEEVSGKPKPDTKITLFAVNTDGSLGAQIAYNDNISGTNLFSKITTSTLAAYTKYALRIENKITNVADDRSKGHYFLSIDGCYEKADVAIVGDNSICSGSKQYYVSNIPATATVT